MGNPPQIVEHGQSAKLRRLDLAIWAITGALAVVVCLTGAAAGFKFEANSFVLPAAGITGLMIAAWFYRTRRPEPRFASALEGTAQLAAFTAFAAPLSYIAASVDLPLHDGFFDAIDRALHFDWMASLAWIDAHPAAHVVLGAAYLSFVPQATVTVLALALSGRLPLLRVFLLSFMLAAIVTIAISAALPAEGVWGFYKLTARDYPNVVPVTRELHLPIFNGLRDGSLRLLLATGSEGIITFPSLHAALGVIFILALWPIPYLRWLGLLVNLLMIAATPVEGGHYFIDVIAGLAIALASWKAAARFAERDTNRIAALPAPRPDLVPGE